jgi:DNA-binding SARP family transcriptional activator
LSATRKWIAVEPYEEAAHRRLMSLYVQMGKRNKALEHYRLLKTDLASGLGTEPLPETQAFVELILSGAVRQSQPVTPRLPKSESRPKLQAFPLVGRQPELGKIQAAWEQAKSGRGRFLLLTGD